MIAVSSHMAVITFFIPPFSCKERNTLSHVRTRAELIDKENSAIKNGIFRHMHARTGEGRKEEKKRTYKQTCSLRPCSPVLPRIVRSLREKGK